MPSRKRPAAGPPDDDAPPVRRGCGSASLGGDGTPAKTPEQKKREREEARLKQNAVTTRLRAHMEDVHDHREEASNPRSTELTRLLADNERLTDNALSLTASQGLMGYRAFAQLTHCAKRQATKVQTGLKDFDTATFVNKIRSQMTGGAAEAGDGEAPTATLDFASLGKSTWRNYARAPAVDFMFGLADIQPRAPIQRKAPTGPRAGSLRGAAAARPENVVDKDKLDKTETDLQIETMRRELSRRGADGTPFYSFLVDPVSFSRSVENIFHSSFLIKDGRARLVMRGNVPTLVAKGVSERSDPGGDAETPMENAQTILRFDYDKWEEVKATYRINASVFPSV